MPRQIKSGNAYVRCQGGQVIINGTAVSLTGGITFGTTTFTGDVTVPAEVYGVGWNGSNEVPTKNDVYDKIEALGTGFSHGLALAYSTGNFMQ